MSDRSARIAAMFAAHRAAVFGYCLRILRAVEAAEDVTQQVFLEAFRDFARFEGRGSELAWLFGIAYHRCMDSLRAGRRAGVIELDDEAVRDYQAPDRDVVAAIDQLELLGALEDCLSRLPPVVRATVLIRNQTGATYEQLAGMLDATPAALQMRVARALPVLKQCLESKGWQGD